MNWIYIGFFKAHAPHSHLDLRWINSHNFPPWPPRSCQPHLNRTSTSIMHVVDAVGPLSRPSFWASALFPSCHVYWQLTTPGCPLLQGMGTEELNSLPRREAAFSQYLTDMAQKYPPLAFSQEKAVVPSTLQSPVGSGQGWTPAEGTPCSAPSSTLLLPLPYRFLLRALPQQIIL